MYFLYTRSIGAFCRLRENKLAIINARMASSSHDSSGNQQLTRENNKLALEKSPYLLQHASNPVQWYPWGDEALEKARREDKIIFLSVGYSTCHWCHVMERESFENPETAKIMNRYFVNIKVDREERPDIDQIYMTFIRVNFFKGLDKLRKINYNYPSFSVYFWTRRLAYECLPHTRINSGYRWNLFSTYRSIWSTRI